MCGNPGILCEGMEGAVILSLGNQNTYDNGVVFKMHVPFTEFMVLEC